jgi:hypothetical protein
VTCSRSLIYVFTIPILAFTMSDPGVHVALSLAFTFDRSGRSGWTATRSWDATRGSDARVGVWVLLRYDAREGHRRGRCHRVRVRSTYPGDAGAVVRRDRPTRHAPDDRHPHVVAVRRWRHTVALARRESSSRGHPRVDARGPAGRRSCQQRRGFGAVQCPTTTCPLLPSRDCNTRVAKTKVPRSRSPRRSRQRSPAL